MIITAARTVALRSAAATLAAVALGIAAGARPAPKRAPLPPRGAAEAGNLKALNLRGSPAGSGAVEGAGLVQ
ncbi:MAG: hypothetical protein ACHQD6_08695 [Steroidobacterales bacterium]|jgi:hypothetical protein